MRLNVRLEDSAGDLFEDLTRRLNCKPRDLLLDAIALYNYTAKRVEAGDRIGSMSPDGEFTALVTPTLEGIAAETKAKFSELPSNEVVVSGGENESGKTQQAGVKSRRLGAKAPEAKALPAESSKKKEVA